MTIILVPVVSGAQNSKNKLEPLVTMRFKTELVRYPIANPDEADT